MTVSELLKENLSPRKFMIDREILLSYVLNKSKEFILGHPESQLSKIQISKFRQLWKKRLKDYPLAYLIGHKGFFGLDFCVNDNVLIPRPETEFLVERAIAYADKPAMRNIVIADIGTGSGCIAIALKKYLPSAEVVGLDTSAKALALAKINSRRNKTAVRFYRGTADLLIKKKISANIIVANLPYLDRNKKEFYYRNCPALRHEPSAALFADHKGLGDYIRLLKKIVIFKKSPQTIFIEIGSVQITAAKKIFTSICGNKYYLKANNFGGTAIVELMILE